jgi:hypothetical protein
MRMKKMAVTTAVAGALCAGAASVGTGVAAATMAPDAASGTNRDGAAILGAAEAG